MLIDALSNGLGGQSMWLLKMACDRMIPARFSITADTGSEEDRVMSDGTRISAGEFFRLHVAPMALRGGIGAFFTRAQFRGGSELPPLHEHMAANLERHNVPMFGSEGGRLRQTCTDKWKLRAIRQQMRVLGGKRARNAVGIHRDEYERRKSGVYLERFTHNNLSYAVYQTVDGRKVPKPIKWMQHYYPLVDCEMNREAVQDALKKSGIPYLVTSERDHCPHQDDTRWLSHTPETLERVAQLEDRYDGEFFFTDKRIPLRLAIEEMRADPRNSDPIFGCKNGLCGI